MRDWLEQHLRRVLRERAAEVSAQPFSVKQIRQRALRLVLGYTASGLVLVTFLIALWLID